MMFNLLRVVHCCWRG